MIMFTRGHHVRDQMVVGFTTTDAISEFGSCSWRGVTSMLNDLNWQPLQIRRKNKTLIAFHKAVSQNSPVEIPDYVTQSTYSGTRSHSKAFIEIRANYEQYKNSFLPRTIKDWNALPTHLVHVTSVDEFGSRLQSLTT